MKVGERSPTSLTYTNVHLRSLTFTNCHAPMSLSTNSIVFESIAWRPLDSICRAAVAAAALGKRSLRPADRPQGEARF